MFSDAISSRFSCWRSVSPRIAASISGSTRASGLSLTSAGRGDAMTRSLVAFDVVHDVLDGADLLRVLVGDLHLVLFLERHDELDDVQRVGAEVLDERRLGSDLVLAHPKLLTDDFAYLGLNR